MKRTKQTYRLETLGYLQFDSRGNTLKGDQCKHPKIWRTQFSIYRQGCRLCGRELPNGRIA